MKYRSGRLAEEIRKTISEMMLLDLKDPRLQTGMISISAVDVTRDLSYATIYLLVLGESLSDPASPERKQEVLDAFTSANGFIRREVAHRIELRRVPELIFKIDESAEYGKHMDSILDSLK